MSIIYANWVWSVCACACTSTALSIRFCARAHFSRRTRIKRTRYQNNKQCVRLSARCGRGNMCAQIACVHEAHKSNARRLMHRAVCAQSLGQLQCIYLVMHSTRRWQIKNAQISRFRDPHIHTYSHKRIRASERIAA